MAGVLTGISKNVLSVDVYNGGRGSPNLVLSGTLEHLEELDHAGKVPVQVTTSARLVSANTGEVVWQDTSSKTGTPDQRTIAAIVAEMPRQMGSAVESLVSSLGGSRFAGFSLRTETNKLDEDI